MANYPTPQNIVNITYQLLQEIDNPQSIRGQMPILSIQFQDDDSIVRSKMVSFQEMLPYLRMLHEKAFNQGQIIVCNPEDTFDKKIVFEPGDGPQLISGNFVITNQCVVDIQIQDFLFPGVTLGEYSGYENTDNFSPINRNQAKRGTQTSTNGSFSISINNNEAHDVDISIICFGTALQQQDYTLFPGNNNMTPLFLRDPGESLFILVIEKPATPPTQGQFTVISEFTLFGTEEEIDIIDNIDPPNWYDLTAMPLPATPSNSPRVGTQSGHAAFPTAVVNGHCSVPYGFLQMFTTSQPAQICQADENGNFNFQDQGDIPATDNVIITLLNLPPVPPA